MNTIRFALLAPAFMVAALSPAAAQERAGAAPSLDRLAQSLDRDTYRAVMQVIDRARTRALPTDPLVDRALEGAMKRAPGPRIHAAVAALAQRLEIARNALAPSPSEADIAAGAGALAVGVPRDALRAIRSIQPDRSVAVPLGVLTELVARSVPVDQATTLVVQLLRRGATPTQLIALGADVQRDIAAGIEPGAAFDLRTRGVASTLAGGSADFAGRDAAAAPTAPRPGTELSSGGSRGTATRPGTRRP